MFPAPAMLTCAGCVIFWKSKLQTMMAPITESEYIILISAICEMQLLRVMTALDLHVGTGMPTICCQLFVDNSGLLKLPSKDKS
jgi:hypothetical protein